MIECRREYGVAQLTLNRPERHNALVPEMLEQFLERIGELQEDAPKALIVQAHGAAFSTGGDVRELYKHSCAYADTLVSALNRTILALLNFPATVVCVAHGWVTGGALGLLLAADRVFAREDLKIAAYYGVVGFSPDGGWTAILPSRIGARKAFSLIATNDTLNAIQAQHHGLVDEIHETDPWAAAAHYSRHLSSAPVGVLRHARHLINNPTTIATGLDAEREAFTEQIQTIEAREGMQRFLRMR